MRMRRFIFALAASAALAGCDSGVDGRLREAAKQANFIGNPATVQFRNVAEGSRGFLCGDVKYEGADGTWSEWQPFIQPSGKPLELRTPYRGDPVDELNEKLCRP